MADILLERLRHAHTSLTDEAAQRIRRSDARIEYLEALLDGNFSDWRNWDTTRWYGYRDKT